MRNIMQLNFGWKYSPSFSADMIKKSYKDDSFETVDIPHTNLELPLNCFDERSYQFVSCYRRRFSLPSGKKLDGKRYILHFEGAANYSKVYLNGKPIGEHKGAYTPFSFDITDVVSAENLLVVELDSSERKEIPPFGNMVDYLVYGGIYREVWLEEVNGVFIEDAFVRTLDTAYSKKLLDIDVTFSESTGGTLKAELFDGDELIGSKQCDFQAKVLKLKWRVSGIELWDIDNPKLYTIKFTLNGDVDEKTVRFGFREMRFKRDGFYLNGKLIKLRGLNRHQSYPYVGNAMPASAQRADADLLKNTLGVNIVRTAHYPDSVHFLDRCDEIGLLVFTEMPSWQYLGEGEWRENALENIRRMVLRDRNHPSVILWGVRVNEGQDCDEFYKLTNETARSLDDTRQTGGVRNMPRSHLLEDVYTYNDFSHSGSFLRLLPPAIVTGFTAPYLVTEHNGHMFPTKSFDREELRREHALRHTRVLERMYENKRISGAIGWCMADYNTHKDFGSGDRICYHGVTDMFRMPKLAAAIYSSQQDDHPFMEASSSMDIGEYPGSMMGQIYIFTNCDYVKLYKNGKYTSTAYPARDKFPALPHPPIFADDFFGDVLTSVEQLPDTSAKLLKNAMVAASKYGFIMPPQHYLEAGAAIVAGRLSISRIFDIVTKYVANWGDEQVEYKFEGYKDGELVKTVIKTAVTEIKLSAKADSDTLVIGDTYDVTRIAVEALDQNGNRTPYIDAAVKVSVKGPVSVIGPTDFPLVGGDRAFWVRTTGEKGDAVVTLTSKGFSPVKIKLTVK